MARLNDRAREITRMYRVIDTLTSAIYALCEVANGNEKAVAILFDCDCEEMDAVNEAYEVVYKKLVGSKIEYAEIQRKVEDYSRLLDENLRLSNACELLKNRICELIKKYKEE